MRFLCYLLSWDKTHVLQSVSGFYGTGIKIWAGFGLVGINEKKPFGRL